MKKKILVFIRFLVTIAIFFVLFKLVPYKQLVALYQNSHKGYLFLALAVFVINYFIGIFRWKFLLSSLGLAIPVKELFCVYFSGLFLNLFFPSFVAGDIFRGASIGYRYGDGNKVASSILMDRFSGSSAVALVAMAAAYIGRNIVEKEQSIFICLSVLCLLIGIIALFIFTKSFFRFSLFLAGKRALVRAKLISFHEQLYFFKRKPQIFFTSLLFSLPLQLMTVIGFYVASKAFLVDTHIFYFFIIVPIVAAIATVPITPAGAGTREAAAVYFFSLIGLERSVSLGISLVNFISVILMGLLGGIVYVSLYHRYIAQRSQATAVKNY